MSNEPKHPLHLSTCVKLDSYSQPIYFSFFYTPPLLRTVLMFVFEQCDAKRSFLILSIYEVPGKNVQPSQVSFA